MLRLTRDPFLLHGSNGTSYRSIRSRAGHPPNVWRTTFVAFEATEWTLCADPIFACSAGVASFSDVISDVERLSIHHETSSTVEADSRSDNIQLVEGAAIPTLSQWGLITLGMFLLATMFVVTRQRVPIGG